MLVQHNFAVICRLQQIVVDHLEERQAILLDARVKENRLSLLKMIDDYLLETADYSKIVLN